MSQQHNSGTQPRTPRRGHGGSRQGTIAAAILALAGLAFAGLAPMPGGAAAAERRAAGPPARAASPPIGFGSIPFGTEADAVLALNNGNGNLTYPAQGPAVFTYPVVLAGLRFQVTQNFDQDNRAIDSEAVYTSGEDERSCVARFNYLLTGLNARYGPPTVVPDVMQEVRGGNIVSLYASQHDFSDRTSIRGTVETTKPEAGGGAAPGAGGGTNCRISLHYYPPGWLASY